VTSVDWQDKRSVVIVRQVKQVTSDVLGIPASELELNDHFINDLGADSLNMFEIRMALEAEFRLVIPDQDVAVISTVAEVSKYFLRRLGKP